ncbi:MAG: T9SS type A sorting domain-containing protein [Saprospiraceae bacterium]
MIINILNQHTFLYSTKFKGKASMKNKRKNHMPLLSLSILLIISSQLYAQRIAAGGRHSLAICHDSTVQAWGYNGFGQLGNGNINEQHSGTPVVGLNGITQVSGGLFHSLFVKSDGTVWSCGRNSPGNLGNGTNTNSNIPVQVLVLTNITQSAGGGEHSLFLKSDSTVWACGNNSSGQLGDGTNINKSTPIQISGLSGIIQITAGAEFSLFLKNNGTVWACGHNGYGQFGNGTNTSNKVPVLISGLSNIVQLSAGEWHSLFVNSSGSVFSSGRNQYGQLGNGTTINNNTASLVTTLSGITLAEAGGIHSVFLKNDGTVWSCGLNSGGNNDGQLGDGTTVDRHTPVQVISAWGSGSIVRVEATREHSLFLKSDGILWAAGRNNYGQLGTGAFTNSNSLTPELSGAVCNSIPTTLDPISINKGEIQIFPNPSSGVFYLKSDKAISRLEVINILGETVFSFLNTAQIDFIEINLSDKSNGIFFIRITDFNNRFMTQKISLQQTR